MSSSEKTFDYSEFIGFLSENGFSGKLPCDIRVSYQIKDKDGNVKPKLKFLKDCEYKLQGFNLLYFKPTKDIIILVGHEYFPIFQLNELF